MTNLGKKVDQQHHDVTEDQKPKPLDIPMASQVQLFQALSLLPETQRFPNWASLKAFYESQHVRGSAAARGLSGDAIFSLKLSVTTATSGGNPATEGRPDTMEPVSKTTDVILPAALQQKFPVSMETPFASLPCPCCHRNITVSLSYDRKVEPFSGRVLPEPESEKEEFKAAPVSESHVVTETGRAPILAEIERELKV